MNENNTIISAWLHEIKATVERFMGGGARPDGGLGVNWDDRIQGDNVEDEAMLSGAQSFDFLK